MLGEDAVRDGNDPFACRSPSRRAWHLILGFFKKTVRLEKFFATLLQYRSYISVHRSEKCTTLTSKDTKTKRLTGLKILFYNMETIVLLIILLKVYTVA